jgi:hypothetical protein
MHLRILSIFSHVSATFSFNWYISTKKGNETDCKVVMLKIQNGLIKANNINETPGGSISDIKFGHKKVPFCNAHNDTIG